MPPVPHSFVEIPVLGRFAFCVLILTLWMHLSALKAQADSIHDVGSQVSPLIESYCVSCHGDKKSKGDLNFEEVLRNGSVADNFKTWEKVIDLVEYEDMPPIEEDDQPSEEERSSFLATLRQTLDDYIQRNAGDPGKVALRRLTSAEYAYTVEDLTGLDLNLEKSFVGEAVGGEGFSNVGEVQFMQDSSLERYLEAAKTVASHAVIGAGPLFFYQDPGRTGRELSAINRIRAIYEENGFRTGAGEGAKAYGTEMYAKAFYVAWRFRHRREREDSGVTVSSLAESEGISVRFAEHIWSVLNQRTPSFPTSNIVSAWKTLPGAGASEAEIRRECTALYDKLLSWQTTLAASTQDDEEYPVLTTDPFQANQSHSFSVRMNRAPEGSDLEFEIRIQAADDSEAVRPAVLWRNPRMQITPAPGEETYDKPLRELVTAETADQLQFGVGNKGVDVGPNDFISVGRKRLTIRVKEPSKMANMRFKVDAVIDVISGDDCLVRCEVTDGAGTRETISSTGAASALLSHPESPRLEEWKSGILDFALDLAQVSHREATPSDRDWIPAPFDNTYNKPERNYYHTAVKYHRDDRFLTEKILDRETVQQLDHAWTDLLTAFDYHDTIYRFILKKHELEGPGESITDVDENWIESLSYPEREYAQILYDDFVYQQRQLDKAENRHLEEAIEFAGSAWRRPLTAKDRKRLEAFYHQLRDEKALDHEKAIRALLTRVLVAPEFLYRIESPSRKAPLIALSDFEMASRLSYFLWSSKPDAALLRAAAQGELSDPKQLASQTRRMLKDARARRLATEFFGQWLGFYRFDDYSGIDSETFPMFDSELKQSLYEESVRFFEYIVMKDRSIDELLFADYAFLNKRLAEHYGIPWEENKGASEGLVQIGGVKKHKRGGLLRLGTVLAVTSAPQRTSAVKRGDWILRRILGTPTPPPPADVGSIPAEEVLPDGLTVRERLEAHRTDSSCVNCHTKIDPLGFALENFNPIGQWRASYGDGGKIDTTGILDDGTEIADFEGLTNYLSREKATFYRNFCRKLLGYALGRGEILTDRLLIDKMLDTLEDDNRISTLITLIVTSQQFRYQRGQPLETAMNVNRDLDQNER